MTTDMNEFEKYLIERIDELDAKLTSQINEVNNKVTWIYAFSTAVSFVIGLGLQYLQSKN